MLKVGQAVAVKQPVIKGVVKRLVAVEEGTRLEYLVSIDDGSGETHERHYTEDQLVPVEEKKEGK